MVYLFTSLLFIAEDADSLNLNMVYGRKDCNNVNPDQRAEDEYPAPHRNFSDTTDYFGSQFQLTPNETIALLGTFKLHMQ